MAAALVFPVVLLYYEIIFRLFTVGGVLRPDGLITLSFCFVYGGVGYLLCTISRRPGRNRVLAAVLLALTAVPYVVVIFVYQAFKIFYNVNTVLNGANDVATGFAGQVFKMVFSVRGIGCILLYLLPGVLYGRFGGLLGDMRAISGRARAMTLARMAAFYLICLLGIRLSPAMSQTYGDRYSFQPAVERFGMLTGLRLDIQNNMTGGVRFTDTAPAARTASAEAPEETKAPETEAEASEETKAPKTETENAVSEAESTEGAAVAAEPTAEPEYGYNEMDLALDTPYGGDDQQRLNAYVASLTPSKKNAYTGLFAGKNLILITAEAFSKEVIDPDLTPTLYRLATRGVRFTDYYQPASAGTTGGEYQHIFGLMATDGGTSFPRMADNAVKLNMGFKLNELGYYGKAFHNNTYTYYDRDETHTTLGYSDGFMGMGNGMEQYVQEVWPESDYEMFAGTLPTYIDRQPFDVYYMTVSGHNGYDVNGNAMSAKHRDQVKDLPYSETVQNYIGANLELEDALTYLVEQLELKGIADDTVICLTADHFPYGLDEDADQGEMENLSELYGYDVETILQRDHSCWILWSGCLEDREPITVDAPTFSLDILPTLLNLFGVRFDSRLLPGRDVFSDAPALIFDAYYDWKTELGTYYASRDAFEPAVDASELPAGYVEEMNAVVGNKLSFCQGVLDTDYYTYILSAHG